MDFVLAFRTNSAVYSVTSADDVQSGIFLTPKREDNTRVYPGAIISTGPSTNGEPQRQRLLRSISANVELMKYNHNKDLGVEEIAHFIRELLHRSLRSRSAYLVDTTVLGFDTKQRPRLFGIDPLGTKLEMNVRTGGLSATVIQAILDQHYREDLTKEESFDVIKTCLSYLHYGLSNKGNVYNVHYQVCGAEVESVYFRDEDFRLLQPKDTEALLQVTG